MFQSAGETVFPPRAPFFLGAMNEAGAGLRRAKPACGGEIVASQESRVPKVGVEPTRGLRPTGF